MKFKNYLNEGLLQKLIRSKKIFIDNGEYVGKAADGKEVSLGNIGDEKQVEKYLKSHPDPKDW